MSRILLSVVLSIGLLFGVVAQAGELRRPRRTSQRPPARSAFWDIGHTPSGGSGVTSVNWALHDGSQHAFEVGGLGVTGTREAVVSVDAIGEVFDLKKVADFEGTYTATHPHGKDREEGTGQVSLTNEHGVLVSLSLSSPATTSDVTLTPSPTGINIKWKSSPRDDQRHVVDVG